MRGCFYENPCIFINGSKVDKYWCEEQFDFTVSLYIFLKFYGKLVRYHYAELK